MAEIWKRYNNKYEASSYGNVRHIKHKRNLKYSYPSNGTPQVKLENHSVCVSKIISSLFIGERPVGYDIHHKDHNPSNNNIENLDYVPVFTHRSSHKKKFETAYCLMCGKKLPNHKGKYCSRKCEYMWVREERICLVCGKSFFVNKRLLEVKSKDPRYPNGVGLYCSNGCRYIGRKRVPNLKNTRNYRLAVQTAFALPSTDSREAVNL